MSGGRKWVKHSKIYKLLKKSFNNFYAVQNLKMAALSRRVVWCEMFAFFKAIF